MSGGISRPGNGLLNLRRGGIFSPGASQIGGGVLVGAGVRGDARMLEVIGDSRMAASRILVNTTSNRQVFEAQTSVVQYALSAAGHRLFFPEDAGFGKSADTAANVLARMSDPSLNTAGNFGVYSPVSHLARYAALWVGINGFTQDDVRGIITKLIAAGKIVLLFNETPVTTFGTSGSSFDNWIAYHNWLNTLAVPGRVIIVDSWSAILDPATDGTTYQPLSGVLIDDRHPNAYGAYLIGQKLKDAFVSAGIPAFDYSQLPTSNTADAYNASTNPWGVINTNPLIPVDQNGGNFNGTVGSVSGSICTGYTVRTGASGISITCAQGTDGNGDYQDISWTGSSGAGTPSILFQQDPSNGTFSATDKYFVAAQIKFDASALVGVKDIAVLAGFTSSGSPSAVQAKAHDVGLTTGYASGLGSNIFTFASAPVDKSKSGGTVSQTLGRVLVDLTANATSSGSIRIYKMTVRKWQWN